jgi:hypothetical protein
MMPIDREALKKWILNSRAEMTAALKELLDTPGISIADRKRLAMELKALERAKENDERLLGANTRKANLSDRHPFDRQPDDSGTSRRFTPARSRRTTRPRTRTLVDDLPDDLG